MKDNKSAKQEEDEQKKTLFQKFKEYMGSLVDKAKENTVVKAASNAYENISKTKTFRILTGKAVGRAVGLVSLVAGAAGLFTVAPFALPVIAVGMALAVVADTYMVYRTKKIYQEAKMLRNNKVSLDKQTNILKNHPNISQALEGKLFVPNTIGASKTKALPSASNPITSFIKGAVVAGIEGIGGIVNGVLLGNPVSTVISLATTITGIASSGGQRSSLSATRGNLRNFIAEEQKKGYSPAYDDIKSLKKQVNLQRTQGLALEELSKEKGINTWPPEKVQQKFGEIFNKIADRTIKIQEERSVFVKYGRKIFKNFVRAHDPFSKYTDAGLLNAKMTKAVIVTGQAEIGKQNEPTSKTPKEMQNIASSVTNKLNGKQEVKKNTKETGVKKTTVRKVHQLTK